MGEPATPSPEQRAATRELAAKIVQSVRNDGRHPLAPGDHGTLEDADEETIEMAMFYLAQEIDALRADLHDVLSLNMTSKRHIELCAVAGVKP